MNLRAGSMLLATLALCSCNTQSASHYATNQIYADLAATSTDGANTTVSAVLRTGALSLTFIELTTGDSLVGSTGSTSHPLVEASLLGIVSYAASFSGGASGTAFNLALTRTVDSGAPTSAMTLPLPFTLTAPPSQVSRAAAVTFTWTNSAAGTNTDPQDVIIKGDCLEDYTASIDASATQVTVAAGALYKKTSSSVDTCDANLVIERKRAGTVDPHYLGGTATGVQARGATFQSAP